MNNDYENLPEYKMLPPRQKAMVRRLYRTKIRIQKWARINGWENIKNFAESVDDNGNVQWHKSDYEYVCEFYKRMLTLAQPFVTVDGNPLTHRKFNIEEIKTLSIIWARYPNRVQYAQDFRVHRDMHYPNGWSRVPDALVDGVNTVNANEIIRQYMESDGTQRFNNGWTNRFGNMIDDLERLNNV